MSLRYRSYNPTTSMYGLWFSGPRQAYTYAKRISTIYARECWVIDTNTGEIIAMYSHGIVEYKA